ncbi:MAG: B12-binding domain-containing radical SAM protein [Anaerolineales bacterium]|nr:B12-binding domain-containing radical SAM protein [Anaerolineales bacterium]
MKRKLLLINPVNPVRTGLTVNKSSRFPPISLGIIAALTPESWTVELIDENWEPFEYQPADLVGITAFTASAPRAYEIAGQYRQRGIPVVMGGIHASMCTDEAAAFVDSVVTGEAESVWPQLIEDFEEGWMQPRYHGSWGELAGMPRPRRDLFHPEYLFASVQTSRGCPMDCEFCSVSMFNGQRYRRRPSNEVLDELEAIPHKMIFFVDDNIVGYGKRTRQQALQLFKGMVERNLDKLWFCQASINFADDEELLFWASKAGCKMVFLGLEAEEADTLQEVNKKLNVQRGISSYSQAFERIHRAGISVLGAFIFGMDGDTPKKLCQRADFIKASGVDVIQTTLLTPLPGTRLYQKYLEEDRLLYTEYPQDWQHYDMTEVIHSPGKMTPARLEQVMAECNAALYSWPVLLAKAFHTFRNTRDMTAAMFAWNSNINYRKIATAASKAAQ